MKNFALTFSVLLGLTSASAFAGGNAENIRWNCSSKQGYSVTLISIANGEAIIRTYMTINGMGPMIVGGPYKDLVLQGGGDFVGVKTTDGSFSLIGNDLTATLNDGATLQLNNVHCK